MNSSVLTMEQKQELIANINWTELLPAVFELIKLVTEGKLFDDIAYTWSLVEKIIRAIAMAEQQVNFRIPWELILPILIEFLLPIFLINQQRSNTSL